MITENYIMNILLENASSMKEKREILAITESERTNINNNMITKLFDSAMKKSYIDYGDIPKSKGDITKYSGYNNMVESLDLMKKLSDDNRIKIPELDIVTRAIGNIVANRNIFETGFKLNKDFIVMLYNSLVSACVVSTSALISSYVDFIKRIDMVEFKIINPKFDIGDIQIQSLQSFNESVAKGDFSKATNTIIKTGNKNPMTESLTAGSLLASASAMASSVAGVILIPVAIIVGVIVLVQIIRLSVFYFEEAKLNLANYLEMQAMFLELNKNNINAAGYNVPASKKKEILKKQQKIIDRLRHIAGKLSADMIVSEKRAMDNIEEENRGWKFSDVKTDSVNTDSSGYQLL